MMTLLQAISDILRPNLIERGPLLLEETDAKSTCKAITLHKSGQAFMVRPDRSAGGICPRVDCSRSLSAPDRLFPLFRVDLPDIGAMCDYIVFCHDLTRDENRLFILHCEMKSTSPQGSRKQIENGKLLADYIVTMAKHHRPMHALSTVEHRGLVFCNKPGLYVPKGNLQEKRCRYTPPFAGGLSDLKFAYYPAGKEYPLSHFCV
ncbi:MAG: hypothetical protein IPM54_02680 [Polyangiaceae bacterium]|nr:hypothetical protein [Polyangiaceae bacterium]